MMTQSSFRILHVLPWASVGGTELATLRIAQATSSGAFAHTALCLSEADEVRRLFTEAGFDAFDFAAVEPSWRHPRDYWRTSWRLAQQIRARRIDLMHCADVLAAYYASLAGRLAGVPVLCHVRNRFERITHRDRTFLYPVNRFVFVSRHTWQLFDYRVPPSRGSVLYDGIEVRPDFGVAERAEVRAELGLKAEDKVIGMVARIAPQKDYATLVKAAAQVVAADPQARFLIVGDYAQTAAHREHYREVSRLINEGGLASHFIFTGFRADVPRVISVMDLFVLSTHCEGLPLVILEAMAQGKPVIATAVDGIPEIVRHNETGLLSEHENAAQLAEQMLALLSDEQRAARYGAAGRRVVETEFSRERFAANVTKLYRGILQRHSGPAEAAGEWEPVTH